MRLSILTPSFNSGAYIERAVQSVLAQNDPDFEHIVVDDGSQPEQWERTKAMAGPQVQVLQRRDGIKGPSRCRNLGLKAAQGDYVLFLDSDDLLAPWCLEHRLRATQAPPEADLWVFPASEDARRFISNYTSGKTGALWTGRPLADLRKRFSPAFESGRVRGKTD